MGQSRWSDSGRSFFGGPPPGGGSRGTCGSWPEGCESSWRVGVTERAMVAGSGVRDGLQRGGPEVAQDVVGAPGELARDRQRRARVAEPAGLEREVIGVVGTARSAGRQRRLIERPAQLRRALAGQFAGPGTAVG